MKVKSLDDRQFEECCSKLASMIKTEWSNPDIIVGIKSGGKYVADKIAMYFPEVSLTYAVSRRPSTRKKKNVGKFLKFLPTVILNGLRIVESMFLKNFGSRERQVTLKFGDLPANEPDNRQIKILIVDDAVDSGETLLAVKNRISEMSDNTEIKTAVITVTTDNPVIKPDYTVFDDKTLIRFPWSIDCVTK